MQVDAIIVGQGLAGSLLAFALHQRGQQVMLLDDGVVNASQVAAGLINPVTGQRLVKSVSASQLLQAKFCYQQLEQLFAQPFFYALPMLKLLQTAQELETASKRLRQADYADYLQDWQPAWAGLATPFGVLRQRQTGFLLTVPLLSAIRAYFLARQSYRQTRLDYSEIIIKPAAVAWRDISANYLIFCEGWQAVTNPWFKHLPFQLAKGQILTGQTDTPLPPQMLNYGRWLIPQPQGGFKTGATFEPRFTDVLPTAAARTMLLQALQQAYAQMPAYSINAQQAGIRPATLDKQPFMGAHPQYKNVLIFNGFGAKASMLAPWCAQQLCDYLLHEQALPAAMEVNRYEFA